MCFGNNGHSHNISRDERTEEDRELDRRLNPLVRAPSVQSRIQSARSFRRGTTSVKDMQFKDVVIAEVKAKKERVLRFEN
jgi:hypothetical protein